MDSNILKRQISMMRETLFIERVLDSQFTRLEEVDPNFAGEMTDLYFGEVPSFMGGIEKTLETIPLNVANLREYLGKFKGSSASIGASKVINVIDNMIDCCKMGNIEGCKAGFSDLKNEVYTLKYKLEFYLQLLQQERQLGRLPSPSEDMISKNK